MGKLEGGATEASSVEHLSPALSAQPKAPKVKCPYCLEEISKGATRCKWCTSQIDPENVLPAPNMGKEVPAKPVSGKDQVRRLEPA